ncbi:DNA polymerase zeta processivity subunit like protein [Verticillium longisporum]|uniref:DNA polymerase zeta processivity subunit like protein n=1 Tax=Verticillium longisporum TaxID=100787 RepID=A0A8I2Z2Y6_VERLO|nr:DNA polymerase zeta processivity subunit like protein [Verticillium longisporum]
MLTDNDNMQAEPSDEDLPQPQPGPDIPRPQARSLLQTFSSFLTMTLHTLIFHRALYPRPTFLLARHNNLVVPQSRHPAVCAWINDAVGQVTPLLAVGRLAKVTINFHLPRTLQVVDRWVIDVSHFPAWIDEDDVAVLAGGGQQQQQQQHVSSRGRDRLIVAWEQQEKRRTRARREDEAERELAELERAVNWVDVDEAVRGALSRIGSAAATKGPLPEDSTFTVAVELREDAPVPIGHPQHWIPSDPSLQYGADPLSGTPRDEASTEGPRGTSTIPLRTVDAGPLFWECWVEECPSVQPTTTAAAAAAAAAAATAPSQDDSARESNST